MVDHERVPSQAGVRIVNKFSNYIKSSAIIANLSRHRIDFCKILQYSRIHVTQSGKIGLPRGVTALQRVRVPTEAPVFRACFA